MTGIVTAHWAIAPSTPPQPLRHCSTCGQTRPFQSSGKVRLNANGRRLDASLIYKCTTCDRTWNLPLVERAPVTSLSAADLAALQHSDPEWVRQREADLTLLARHCDRIEPAADIRICKTVDGVWPAPWAVIELTFTAMAATGQRLDRVLAQGFGFSRAEVIRLLKTAGLVIRSPSGCRLNRPIMGTVSLRIAAQALSEAERALVSTRLAAE
jgi:hypothetical protein